MSKVNKTFGKKSSVSSAEKGLQQPSSVRKTAAAVKNEERNAELEEKNFEKRVLTIFEFGDIFAIIKILDECKERKDLFQFTEELILLLGKALTKFGNTIFVPIEYAEALLTSIGTLLQSPHINSQLSLFISNQFFVCSLIDIIIRYSLKFTYQEPLQSSFTTHFCYEFAMYILLTFFEQSSLMGSFLKLIEKDVLRSLFTALGEILPFDILYLTQVSSSDASLLSFFC
jgi:hypothetical protein